MECCITGLPGNDEKGARDCVRGERGGFLHEEIAMNATPGKAIPVISIGL